MIKKYAEAVCLAAVLTIFSTSASAAETMLVPVGRVVGIQFFTDGLLVVGTSEINGKNIAKECGIRANDRITAINGESPTSSENFAKTVNEHPEGIKLEIMRDNLKTEVNAVPALSEDDVYRLGLWVRDSCAGVGTLTYYNPLTGSFAALGHAINDVDTGNILSLKSGNILNCEIVSVSKSSRGSPGEINASFGSETLGNVTLNSDEGLFGKASAPLSGNTPIPVAAKEQIHEGEAYILSDIIGSSVTQYSVKIKKILNDNDKGLVIEITDDRLKDIAGGIVQGMSGSPIIQDGRLVGAVTHVFVNSPLKGYGTLAERMLDTERKNGTNFVPYIITIL